MIVGKEKRPTTDKSERRFSERTGFTVITTALYSIAIMASNPNTGLSVYLTLSILHFVKRFNISAPVTFYECVTIIPTTVIAYTTEEIMSMNIGSSGVEK